MKTVKIFLCTMAIQGIVIHAQNKNAELIQAISSNNTAFALQLLQEGASARAANNTTTALIEAVRKKNKQLVQKLIEYGADLEARDAAGATALIEAAYLNNKPLVDILIKKGAAVNAQDNDGRTALMWTDDPSVATLLVRANARVDITNANDDTVLDLADDDKREAIEKAIKKEQYKKELQKLYNTYLKREATHIGSRSRPLLVQQYIIAYQNALRIVERTHFDIQNDYSSQIPDDIRGNDIQKQWLIKLHQNLHKLTQQKDLSLDEALGYALPLVELLADFNIIIEIPSSITTIDDIHVLLGHIQEKLQEYKKLIIPAMPINVMRLSEIQEQFLSR